MLSEEVEVPKKSFKQKTAETFISTQPPSLVKNKLIQIIYECSKFTLIYGTIEEVEVTCN